MPQRRGYGRNRHAGALADAQALGDGYSFPGLGGRPEKDLPVPRISIRVDDELHDRLHARARAAGMKTSELVRPVLEEVAWPGGRYVYTGNDEILTIAIQILALVAHDLTTRSPADYAQGLEAARDLLRQRGLLAAGNDPLQGAVAPSSGKEAGR